MAKKVVILKSVILKNRDFEKTVILSKMTSSPGKSRDFEKYVIFEKSRDFKKNS